MAVRNYYFVYFQIDPKDIDGVDLTKEGETLRTRI